MMEWFLVIQNANNLCPDIQNMIEVIDIIDLATKKVDLIAQFNLTIPIIRPITTNNHNQDF